MPGSKLKESLAAVLEREGFIAGYTVEPNVGKPGTTLEITLKYSGDRTRTIAGIKRVSKPGLRIYARADGMPRVLGGMGVAVRVHEPGPADRPRGASQAPGRRGALPCLVAP